MVSFTRPLSSVCPVYTFSKLTQVKSQRQVKEGIDAVIVDSVLAIRQGLTESESQLPGSVAEDDTAVVIDAQPLDGGVSVAN